MADLLQKAVSAEGHFRAVAAVTTGVLEELRVRHSLSPVACVALGRALTGAFLLASELKGQEKLILQILGQGPLREIVAVAQPNGQGRGYVGNPRAEVPASGGKIHLAQALSPPGTVTVIKDLGIREPYRGVAPLVSGEIGKDLANYLWVSEQIPSAVAVGVYVEADLSVGASGGYLVQTMPGASQDEIDVVEQNVVQMPPPTELIRRGSTPRAILEQVLWGYSIKWLGSQPLRFGCRCSKAKVSKALVAMGVGQLEEMILSGEEAEVTCEFCRSTYQFSPQEMENLLASARAKTGHPPRV
ncbi:MAG: Hsp33 family molecular chaperone HslO [Thermodesulfobacteriota bacterium]